MSFGGDDESHRSGERNAIPKEMFQSQGWHGGERLQSWVCAIHLRPVELDGLCGHEHLALESRGVEVEYSLALLRILQGF